MNSPLSLHLIRGTAADAPSGSAGSVPAFERNHPTTEECETFWTDGADARTEVRPVFIKIRQHDCCAGRDLPGIGHTHAPDCLAMAYAVDLTARLRRLLQENEAEPLPVVQSGHGGQVPGHLAEPLQSMLAVEAAREYDQERERLLNLLACAAPDLVALNIRLRGTGVADGTQQWCWECQQQEHEGRIPHRETCYTGLVEGILSALAALDQRPVPSVPRGMADGAMADEMRGGAR